MLMIGLDTGFFVQLLKKEKRAVAIWTSLLDGEEKAVASSLTLFEIERLALKGKIDRASVNTLLEAIPAVCSLGWLNDVATLSQAAKLSHGLGIPAVDAMILAGFVEFNVEKIYTTDSHIDQYKKKGVRVINLAKD